MAYFLQQESSGVASLKAIGTSASSKHNAFVTPNAASDNPKLTFAMLRARADQTKNTEIDAPFSSTHSKPTATAAAPADTADTPFSPTRISVDVRNLSSPKPRSTSTPPASDDDKVKRGVGRPRTKPFDPRLPPASFQSPKRHGSRSPRRHTPVSNVSIPAARHDGNTSSPRP